MSSNTPPGGPGNRPPSLSDLPPGFFGIMEPRPYKNITELLGMLANILLTGERSEDPEFKKRFLELFDTMYRGLSLYIDQEFYSKAGNASPVIVPMEMPDAFVSIREPAHNREIVVDPYVDNEYFTLMSPEEEELPETPDKF